MRADFEQLTREAIAALPPKIKTALENVAFVIERKPRRKKAGELGIHAGEVLLGLYEGVPKTKRGSGYFGVLPDKITIFQKPIEELSGGDENRLKKLVCEVVKHEIGHHLGFDEAELRAIERKRKQK